MEKHKTPNINVRECLTIQAARESVCVKRKPNEEATTTKRHKKRRFQSLQSANESETWSRRNEYGANE